MLNLNNYINMRPGTVAPRTMGDLQQDSFGTGAAALGLPGDFNGRSETVHALDKGAFTFEDVTPKR